MAAKWAVERWGTWIWWDGHADSGTVRCVVQQHHPNLKQMGGGGGWRRLTRWQNKQHNTVSIQKEGRPHHAALEKLIFSLTGETCFAWMGGLVIGPPTK